MREAVGGSILFYIILGFLAIFIVFIAIIMNYAACYRASNYVLTMLERNEGQVRKSELENALRERNYYNKLDVCCYEFSNSSDKSVSSIYKIETQVNFDIPLIGIKGTMPIRNETKTIYATSCNPEYYYKNNPDTCKQN